METIKIVYVDDKLDPYVSKYLSSLSLDEYLYQKKEIKFSTRDSYKSMLSNQEIRMADILFLDSMLFENNAVDGNKLSGEELGFIIKKMFPFKEILVITQFQEKSEFSSLKKYNSKTFGTCPDNFFKQYWEETILKASHNIVQNRKILERLSSENYVDKILLEKLESTMSGQIDYENLTKEDINKLIQAFEEMREVYEQDRL
jgi:putative type II DNA methylase protein